MDARPLCAATTRRAWAGLSLLLVPVLAGASYRTPNFSVEAATPEAAKSVGDHAERCRRAIAKAWLGREVPNWGTPCPIRVQLTAGEAGGETNFDFAGGRVTHQQIRVEGRLDRILASALPHEVTHTIFAAYYGGPMPRWADEGASLLSEDRREMVRHDNIVLNLLNRRSEMSLGQLFQAAGLSQRPDGLLRPGVLGEPVPGRDRRPAPLPPVREGGHEPGLGFRHPATLRAGQLPGTGPRLAVVAPRGRCRPAGAASGVAREGAELGTSGGEAGRPQGRGSSDRRKRMSLHRRERSQVPAHDIHVVGVSGS